MYIVKFAGIRSYPHLFQKHHLLQTTCKNSNTVMAKSFKEPKTCFFFQPQRKNNFVEICNIQTDQKKTKTIALFKVIGSYDIRHSYATNCLIFFLSNINGFNVKINMNAMKQNNRACTFASWKRKASGTSIHTISIKRVALCFV